MAKKVEVIEADEQSAQESTASTLNVKRVAAYVRVSTKSEEQENSFKNQEAQWRKSIEEHEGYQLVDVYEDEGISGTSTKKRTDFQRMIADARAGKIDLILCKSISRFSRNILDSLKISRELKAIGVEVYFDNERLSTMKAESEFTFTVLGLMAQEESRHISENVNWTFLSKMKAGIPFLNATRFLGYDKNEDGTELVINEEQAKTVRYIYDLYQAGEGCGAIAKKLQNEGYENGIHRTKWYPSTVLEILRNEKYVGDLVLQKTFTVDFLTHERKKNTGQKRRFYIKDAHPAIISREQWNDVQLKLAENAARFRGSNKDTSKYASKYPLSGMLICAECGNTYKRRLWNSTALSARKFLFQCNHYSTITPDSEPCHNKPVSEALTEQACCEAINKLYFGKSKVFAKISKIVKSALSSEKLSAQMRKIEQEKLDLSRRMDDLALQRLKAEGIDTKKIIDDHWDSLRIQYSQLDMRLKAVEEREINSENAKDRMDKMLNILDQKKLTPEMLTRDIIQAFFYRIIVTGKNELVFVINATHTMDLKAFVEARSKIVALKPIYQSEIEGPDPIKKAKMKFRVVTI